MGSKKEVNTICSGCFPQGRCGVTAHLENGKVKRIEGMLEHPINRGRLCPKGLASTQILYHPDRLLYPLKRVGKRGDGKWKRITWGDALDTIAGRLGEIKEKHARAPHGWPEPGNVNELTAHAQRDPIFASTPFKSLLCNIRKLK